MGIDKAFNDYCYSLYCDIPLYIYGCLFVALILAIVFVVYRGWNKYKYEFWRVITIEYIIVIYCSTVFFRSVGNVRQFNFMPFWSYGAYFRGEDPKLLSENIMNVVVFIPAGLLLGAAIRGMSWVKAIIIGCVVSVGIEILQLVLKRGFCEFDDVIHNTLGCMIGYGIYRLIYMCVNSKMKRIYGK